MCECRDLNPTSGNGCTCPPPRRPVVDPVDRFRDALQRVFDVNPHRGI